MNRKCCVLIDKTVMMKSFSHIIRVVVFLLFASLSLSFYPLLSCLFSLKLHTNNFISSVFSHHTLHSYSLSIPHSSTFISYLLNSLITRCTPHGSTFISHLLVSHHIYSPSPLQEAWLQAQARDYPGLGHG